MVSIYGDDGLVPITPSLRQLTKDNNANKHHPDTLIIKAQNKPVLQKFCVNNINIGIYKPHENQIKGGF